MNRREECGPRQAPERALRDGDDAKAKVVSNPNPARVSMLPQEVGSSWAAG